MSTDGPGGWNGGQAPGGLPSWPPARPGPSAPQAYPQQHPQQHPQQYPPQGQWAQPPRPPMDGVSIAAFVCGLLGVLVVTVLAGIVLGVIGIVRTRNGARRGRVFAVLGIVASVLWIGLFAAAVAIGTMTSVDRDAGGQVTESGSVSLSALKPGDCMRTFEVGVAQSVDVLPCDQPHGAQVIDQFDLPEGDYPGDEEIGDKAEAGCQQRLQGALGDRVSEGELGLGYFHSQRTTWRLGDRSVLCVITAEEGRLTETFSANG